MRKFICLSVLSMLTLTACAVDASKSPIILKSADIKAGMSINELRDLMGEPQNRQFEGKNEAWQYCATGTTADQYILVWMANEKVTGMQTYKNTVGIGHCENFFRTANWEDAPDASVEIRNR